jgi:hypothetical protein
MLANPNPTDQSVCAAPNSRHPPPMPFRQNRHHSECAYHQFEPAVLASFLIVIAIHRRFCLSRHLKAPRVLAESYGRQFTNDIETLLLASLLRIASVSLQTNASSVYNCLEARHAQSVHVCLALQDQSSRLPSIG